MKYATKRLIIWRSQVQALAGPLDKHPSSGCLFSLYSHVSHLRPAVPWFLPFSQRVSQGSTNLKPWLVHPENKAVNVKLAAFFMLLRKQTV